MPPVLSYPGVYIEEIPSAVHTITGVATSIGAFVGWAPKGSTTDAVLVQSFSDYQRQFGGLDARSLLGYSVSHFFNNGGPQAYIVRLASPAITTGNGQNQVPSGAGTATDGAVAITVTGGVITFTAKNPGVWSSSYGIRIVNPGTGGAGTFDVSVVYAPSGSPLDHTGELQWQDSGERRRHHFQSGDRYHHRASYRRNRQAAPTC